MITEKFNITETLQEGRRSLVYRARDIKDDTRTVLKILRQEYPEPEEIARFKHEFEIITRFQGEGIIRAYRMEPCQDTWMMVLEDFGGESLARLKQMDKLQLTIEQVLSLTVRIAEIIRTLHDRHLIHKDINPSNIVWNRKTDELKIIDFGISSVLSSETVPDISPNALEGTLLYISPEQTGRMNRPTDYRSDFYSLGVTLYELLTTQLPFPTDDPMELVHAHIARIAPGPSDIRPEIPSVVSDIAMKLMSKTAELYENTAERSGFSLKQVKEPFSVFLCRSARKRKRKRKSKLKLELELGLGLELALKLKLKLKLKLALKLKLKLGLGLRRCQK